MPVRQHHRKTTTASIAALFVVLVLALSAVPRASAHPADQYFHTHTITLTPDGAQAVWTVAPGTMLAYITWNKADADGDGQVRADEARAWALPLIDDYLALVDGQPLVWTLKAVDWPASLVDFEVGKDAIDIHLALAWPAAMPTTAQVAFYNQYEEYNSSNWFTVQAEGDVQFRTPLQRNGALTFQMVRAASADPAADADPLRAYWDSGTPAIGASGAQASAPPKRRADDNSASSRLAELVRRDNLSLTFYLTAFAIAIGLGSLHALTPGHGKALVGAYLVGSRGTIHHALALGGIVTMTHTGSVLALGLITLAASHVLLPSTLFPILEMVSGLLVVAMGAGLLYRRWKGWRSVQRAHKRTALRDHLPAVPPGLARPSAPAQASAPGGTSATIAINQPVKVNVYDDVLPQDAVSLGGVNWRALVALGVSGGLVPCPDAIAILLVAVTINRIALGLSLIVAFSLGLAFILTGIGIAMVRSRRLFEGLDTLNRVVPALPMISALVVTGLGVGLTVNAASRADLFCTQSEPASSLDFTVGAGETDDANSDALMLAEAFDVARADVIYMDVDGENRYQLYRVPAAGGSAKQLTEAAFGVWDYQLVPDLTRIAYSTPREYGGSDIWLSDIDGDNARVLLSCEDATCSRVTWSPDGRQLVYERLEVTSPQSPLGVTALWWLDIEAGLTGPVFRDSQLPSYNPSWSPDGQWLSYIAPGTANVQIYNLADGRNLAIPSQTGTAAVWSPDSRALLITDIWDEGGQFFTHLMRYDLDSGALTDLTTVPQAGDTWATWSPDGAWIAIVRRLYKGPGAEMGDQVWLVRANGSDARPLTAAPDVIHGKPVWSPDSRYLIFQRYALAGSQSMPGVWLLDTATDELTQLAPSGNWPLWLP